MKSATITSYAQNREDVILWRALRRIENGFYIDVGAASPEEHSVTRLFSEMGWHGVNIEPNPTHFSALERERLKDINLQIALGEEEGQKDFHVFTDTGLSTFDDNIASRHRAKFAERMLNVQVRTLRDVWREHVPAAQEVHFLKVDVEGFERDVLLGADWADQRPWIVVVESTIPLSTEQNFEAWEHILLNARYHFVYFDGLNRFYIADEHAELRNSFNAPPNVFDDFISVELLRKRRELATTQQDIALKSERETALRSVSDRLRVECAELQESSARLRQDVERSVVEVNRIRHENCMLLDEIRNKADHAERVSRERDALLSQKRKKSLPHKIVSDQLKKFNKATRAQRHRARDAVKFLWGDAPTRQEICATPASAPLPVTIEVSAATIDPTPCAQADYQDWARRHAPLQGIPTFSMSDRPALSFLVNATELSNDLSLMRTIVSLSGATADVLEALIFGLPANYDTKSLFATVGEGQDWVVLVEGADGAAAGLAAALEKARGKYVAVLDAGDLLAPGALNEIGLALADNPSVDILYSDEDRRNEGNVRLKPYLKPSWSPELLYSFNYFGRLTLLRRDLAREVGGFDDGEGAAAEWGLNLRAADAAQMIARLPKILCHRGPESDAGRPGPDAADARRTIENYWGRQGFEAQATTSAEGWQSTTWPLVREPSVSIIIPTKDKAHLLRVSTHGVLQQTDYQNLELIIVDTGSQEQATEALYEELSADARVRIVHFRSKFNYSSACNFGASAARGELLLFLNNDIEVISRNWLTEMARVALRPGVGCVGVKLIFPSLELQHAGVSIGPHLAALAYRSNEGMGFELFGSPNHPRNWLAIMGACQMVTREAFNTVGGFDESYQIAMSDIALCLQLWRAGYRTAYTPEGALVHHEGATRGRSNPADDMRRLADDIRMMGIDEDPYLHPGLEGDRPTPQLQIPGGETPGLVLKRHISQFGSINAPIIDLDLFNDGRAMELVGLTRSHTLWPPQPAYKVLDTWSAVRWTLDLLRRRPDIRARFPDALTGGWAGPFAWWLATEAQQEFGLPVEATKAFKAMFAAEPGARARRLFYFRSDVKSLCPSGLTPAGNGELFRWFMRFGRKEGALRLEEIWWLFCEASENPERELMWTYLLSPAWQITFRDAASPFGANRFARWFGATHRLYESWLDPSCWKFPGSPADQIRLAWLARDDWREAYPEAMRDKREARALLDWLLSGSVAMEPWVATWLRGLDLETVAEELARPGLNVIAHFCYPSGLRVSAEAIVEGLREVDFGLSLRDLRTDAEDDPGHHRFTGLEIYDTTIIHTQPEPFYDDVYDRADLAERTPRSYRIAYWYWEFDVIPDSWLKQAAQVDEVWTATEFVAKGLRDKLTMPVRTMFPGVRLPSFEPHGRAFFNLSEDETIFLFTFHMMSVMERKNPAGLARAFKRAFRPDEPARLVLKTTFGDRQPKLLEELRCICEGARITIINEVYTPNDVLALMETCDVYVSLHRSEGLGLTMAEAMLMGKPVVATGYSGNTDFMNADNSLLVDYTLQKLGEPIPPYDADFEWAAPSEQHAAKLMRRLYDDRDFRLDLGRKAKLDAEEHLSLSHASRRIRARLAEIDAERRAARKPLSSRNT